MKNTAQLTTLFALSNLWMARKKLMGMGKLRVEHAEMG
jgi:IS5 family transposase